MVGNQIACSECTDLHHITRSFEMNNVRISEFSISPQLTLLKKVVLNRNSTQSVITSNRWRYQQMVLNCKSFHKNRQSISSNLNRWLVGNQSTSLHPEQIKTISFLLHNIVCWLGMLTKKLAIFGNYVPFVSQLQMRCDFPRSDGPTNRIKFGTFCGN